MLSDSLIGGVQLLRWEHAIDSVDQVQEGYPSFHDSIDDGMVRNFLHHVMSCCFRLGLVTSSLGVNDKILGDIGA